MINETQKTNSFLETINSIAHAKSTKIREETDSYIAQELEKARQRAHEDLKVFKKNEIDRLNEETNAGFSELEAKETKMLLDRRAEITDNVFSKAKAKLIEFVASDKYLTFLIRSIEEIKIALGNDTVIFLKPDDKKYEAELSKLCREIKYDPTIEIGGCKAENIINRMVADDTLETKLNAEKSIFYKTSGLSVTK
ncbi:MAG: hypothetical protein MJ168_09600 [Clostridia bacterium]|nr:hypothetical protein [Clostridia bacterium]